MSSLQMHKHLDVPMSFADAVGPRSTKWDSRPQPAYVALYVGGHDGVRLSCTPDEARALAALLLASADDVDSGDPDRLTHRPIAMGAVTA